MKKSKNRKKLSMLGMLLLCMIMAGGCGKKEATDIRVASLKGPTSMGLVELMNESEENNGVVNSDTYSFTMETAADTLLPLIIKGEVDIALLPANVASVLYNKTEGAVSFLNINTLGVLYIVTGDESINELSDLEGKTIYLTGKGTTPDYVLQYLLEQNGLSQSVTLEYKSEATEVAALLKEDPSNIGLLPQPFATVAVKGNEALEQVMDLNEIWQSTPGTDGNLLVTGVTVVRNEFLEEHPDAVQRFLEAEEKSVDYINENPVEGGELVSVYGILDNASVAAAAIPYCSISFIDGTDGQNALNSYLNILFELSPDTVGGAVPGEDFYPLNQ